MTFGQGELLEAPPSRHVVMPREVAESPCWWGVDTGTSVYHVGWATTASGVTEGWDDEGVRRGVESVKLGPTNENWGERLARWHGQATVLVGAMLDAGIPAPGVVFVERAAGASPEPSMHYAVGIVSAAIYGALNRRLAYVPRIELVSSMHWKLIACGQGNLSKPRYGKGVPFDAVREDYDVLRWARAHGLTADARDCWDRADAMGITDCARRDIAIRG